MAEAVGVPYPNLVGEHPPDPSFWKREFTPDPLERFNERLRILYGHSRAQTGSKGDNRHLSGRHRSVNWDLYSRFCVNRAYGTRDQRDMQGNGDALRATDVGLSGPRLWAACRRLDAAVRAGRLPLIAEWFGTFDGRSVVGWFEGHLASSDSSHLYHAHLGYWTVMLSDAAQFDLLFDIFTGGDDDVTPEELRAGVVAGMSELLRAAAHREGPTGRNAANWLYGIIRTADGYPAGDVDTPGTAELAPAIAALPALFPTAQEIAEAVVALLDESEVQVVTLDDIKGALVEVLANTRFVQAP